MVVSRYHADITDRLLDGAIDAYRRSGPLSPSRPRRRADAAGPAVIDAPGSFELVALSLAAARSGRFDGVVALGCIIKGQTRHDEHIARAVVSGLAQVTIATGVPVSLGVLTVGTVAQARARAGGPHGNKGAEAMRALLATIASSRRIAAGRARAREGGR